MSTYKPTNDYIFGRIFGDKDNESLLKDLLEAILPHLDIDTLEVNKQVPVERQKIKDKLGVMDILVTLNNGIKVNIEMQVKDYKNTIDRSLFYLSGVFHESLESGKNYATIPYTIGIWICNFDIFDDGPFHEIGRIRRDYGNILLTDKYELHYIQLPKFKRKCKRISSKLEQWLTFIINENLEEIKMSDNELIKEAEEKLEALNADKEAQRLAELREKAIRDEAAALDGAFTRGKEQGLAEGRSNGILENSLQIAKKMLDDNFDIETIIKLTGLTREDIENL